MFVIFIYRMIDIPNHYANRNVLLENTETIAFRVIITLHSMFSEKKCSLRR